MPEFASSAAPLKTNRSGQGGEINKGITRHRLSCHVPNIAAMNCINTLLTKKNPKTTNQTPQQRQNHNKALSRFNGCNWLVICFVQPLFIAISVNEKDLYICVLTEIQVMYSNSPELCYVYTQVKSVLSLLD